jgi:hypothetical protein
MKMELTWVAMGCIAVSSCGVLKKSQDASPGVTYGQTAPTYIYVASGTTYAGNGVTTSTPTNVVVRFKENGAFDSVVADYSSSPGDSPVELANYDDNYLLVLVENASGRRIDKVAKSGNSISSFITNSTALSAQMRSLIPTFDGGWLVSKSTAIEKFSSSKARVLIGANPYVNAPGGTCATSTTLISRVVQGPGNNIIYLHAAASPNNKIGMIKSTGYSTASDCVTSMTAPTVNHYPTAALVHSSGRLLVSYGNTTGPVNEIYSYPVTSTSIGAGVSAFNNISVLQGISYMAEMPDATILVTSMVSTFNTIEQFTYDTGTNSLLRMGTTSFIGPNVYTRSISSILIAN